MPTPRGLRRWPLLALALTALLAAPAAVTVHAQDPLALVDVPDVREPHASILIDGDDAFLGDASGVRGGSGTADDPYRITGWSILRSDDAGIELVDTRAHVVIDDVGVTLPESGAAGRAAGCVATADDCLSYAGVRLTRAENVTIHRVDVDGGSFAIRGVDASHVVIDGYRFRPENGKGTPTVLIGFTGGRDVTLRHLNVSQRWEPVRMTGVDDVLVEDSFIRGSPVAYLHFSGPARNLTIRDNLLETTIPLVTAHDAVRVTNNTFTGDGTLAIGHGYDDWNTSVLVCGNAFDMEEEMNAYPFILAQIGGLHVVGNTIADGVHQAFIGSVSGLDYERNRHGHMLNALRVDGNGRFRDNAFEGPFGVIARGSADFSGNWWGSADGPSGDGPGSGATVHAAAGSTWSPWLTSPPDTRVDCDALSLPAVVPPPERMVQTFIVPHAAAVRVEPRATGTERVEVRIERPLRGSEFASFVAGYDPADVADADWSWHLTGTLRGSVRAVSSDADAHAHQAAYDVDWGDTHSWTCIGGECPPVAVVAGLSRDASLPTTIRVITTGNATANVTTGPARLVTTQEPDAGTAVTVDALNAGVTAAHDAAIPVHVERALWGFAIDLDALVGASSFRLERPHGSEEHVDEVTFLGDARGTYTFRADGARAGTYTPSGYALVIDLPT